MVMGRECGIEAVLGDMVAFLWGGEDVSRREKKRCEGASWGG